MISYIVNSPDRELLENVCSQRWTKLMQRKPSTKGKVPVPNLVEKKKEKFDAYIFVQRLSMAICWMRQLGCKSFLVHLWQVYRLQLNQPGWVSAFHPPFSCFSWPYPRSAWQLPPSVVSPPSSRPISRVCEGPMNLSSPSRELKI